MLTPSAVAAGRLRISMPADFGRVLMEALTTRFSHSYPQLRLDVGLSDQPVELIREGFDAAIRVGHVDDTNLIAKPLGMLPMALVASPAYLASRGAPDTIASLSRHDHIRYLLRGRPFPISFANGERLVPQGVFDTDSGEAMRIAARNGLGIAQLLRASVMEDLAAGQLVSVLEKHPLPPVPVQVLHGFARAVPGRVSALFRFLDAEMPRWR
ncbi:substrate binding domain-containing protein [Bosea sp. Root670]|uniref:substrate binding domain-containing protein n=1 Tax=Bosea sp. Root670 TaxID=1736583 RepID=UPI000B22755F|nr:substrate binding domain-containing protein [Bosea sp. Root670]